MAKNGLRARVRVVQQERALAEVVEHERGHDEREPGDADRAAAEVAHVGVERLAAGDGEHDRAEDDERRARRARSEEAHRVGGESAAQDRRGARR